MLADFSRNYCVLCAKFRSQSPTCQPRNQGSYFMSCRLPVKWTVPEQPSVRLMLQVDIIVWMCIVSTSWPINICEHFWHTYTKLHYQTMRDHLKKTFQRITFLCCILVHHYLTRCQRKEMSAAPTYQKKRVQNWSMCTWECTKKISL